MTKKQMRLIQKTLAWVALGGIGFSIVVAVVVWADDGRFGKGQFGNFVATPFVVGIVAAWVRRFLMAGDDEQPPTDTGEPS